MNELRYLLEINNYSCQLAGVSGWLVQCLMAAIIMNAMLLKFVCEKPKRKFIIFSLDMSKQAINMLLSHFLNLCFSILYGNKTSTDQCVWYLSSLVLDSTIGIFVEWCLLKSVDCCTKDKPEFQRIRSGNYFKYDVDSQRYKIDYMAWFMQCLFWSLIVVVMKVTVITIQ